MKNMDICMSSVKIFCLMNTSNFYI